MNWSIIIPVGILAVLLIVFMVVKNMKDEKKVVKDLEQDYRHPSAEQGDADEGENLPK